jgi:photosystem II stability/assembly factor-like uncharacterized protein
MNLRALPPHLMLALACAGAAAQPASAADWQSIGPYGGSVFRLARCAAAPAVVYALLARGGVYRSGDGGRTWRDTNRTLPAADYFDLAADPDDPSAAWVIDRNTEGPTRLFHTRDGGAHWRALTAPEGSFVIAAGRGGVVYAAGSGTFARSADQGRTWQSVTASLGPYTGAASIAVDYFRPGLLYAAIQGPAAIGIWVTEDGGATWRPSSQFDAFLYGLRADPHQTGVAVGLTLNGLQRTTDAGRTWQPFGPGGFNDFAALDFSFGAGRPSTVFLAVTTRPTSIYEIDGRSGRGVLLPADSREGAPPWVISADLEDPGSLIVGQQMILAGDHPGIRRTANRGASWADGSHGLAGLFAGPVGIRGPRSFLAGNQRTDDFGNRWTGFLPGRPVQDLAVDPANPETVYAATGGGPDVLWKSGDGGATWRPASIGLLPTSIAASLAIDPRHPRILYLATQDQDEAGGLFLSLDAGASWQRQPVAVIDPFLQVTVDAGDPACAYVATGFDLERSCDAGRTWAGVLGGGDVGLGFVSVAVAPSDPRWVYTAQTQIPDADAALLWRSKDGGQTFDASPLPFGPAVEVELQVDPEAPDVVYAAAPLGGGVFRRQGDGPWQDLSPGLPNRGVYALYVEARPQPRLIASTEAGVRVLALRPAPQPAP